MGREVDKAIQSLTDQQNQIRRKLRILTKPDFRWPPPERDASALLFVILYGTEEQLDSYYKTVCDLDSLPDTHLREILRYLGVQGRFSMTRLEMLHACRRYSDSLHDVRRAVLNSLCIPDRVAVQNAESTLKENDGAG